MFKRIGRLLLSSVIVLSALVALLPIPASATSYTVTTTTSSIATGGEPAGHHRKMFYAQALYWVFYVDAAGGNMAFRTSADGITWSSNTNVRGSCGGSMFSVWYDDTYCYYTYSNGAGGALYFRRGTPNANGTITWDSAEVEAVAAVAGHDYYCPIVTADSSGYPWIGYYDYHGGSEQNAMVVASSTNDGTWVSAAGFPYMLEENVTHCAPTLAVPLTSRKMYAVYCGDYDDVKGNLWGGAAWTGTEVMGSMTYTDNFSVTSNGDIVCLAYFDDNKVLKYRERSAGGVWAAAVTLQAAVTGSPAEMFCTISRWNASGDLRVVWANSAASTVDHIYYVKRTAGVWSTTFDWINESVNHLTMSNKGYPVSFDRDMGGHVGLIYEVGASSPYTIKFVLLTLPDVSTYAATDETPTTMILNGSVTAINDTTITQRGFQWGTSSGVYTGSWTQTGTYGLGSFSHEITGLASGVTYYFRAMALSSEGWGYGVEDSLATTGVGSPTVATGSAINMTTTTATLQGSLTGLGGYTPVYAYFEYGTTTAYGTTTVEQTFTDVSGYTQAITGLTAGTTYHFRAVVRYGGTSYAYGEDVSFATTAAGAPTATTGDASAITSTGATLGGVLTSLGSYTPVYVSFQYGLTASYGSVTAEQTFTAAGAATAAITGLTANTTYHFRIRVRYATSSYAYGADNTFLTLDVFGGSTPTLTVNGANVFLNYATTGDMLFVADITDVYPPYYPNDDVTRYFDVQLLGTDGATVLASVSMPSWGRIPVSIYLNATRAASLTIGALYYVRIIGDFAGTPSDSYHLTAADWRGTDLNALDRWVINTAHILETYYDTTLTAYVMNIGEILNPQGGTIFASGITGLNKIRPDLFQGVASNPIYTTSTWSNGFDAASNWQAQLGTRMVGILNSGGTMCGADGKIIGALFIDLIMVIVIVLFAMRGAIGVSFILCIPILFTGAWLGLISIAWVAVISVVLTLVAVLVFYVQRT